jgi:adenosylhomocysteine nucleosidase
MAKWLIVAAEGREFSGILKRAERVKNVAYSGVAFAREIVWKQDQWVLLANGPGPRLVERALDSRRWDVNGIMSTGFCGALDPVLHVGDIVISGEAPKRTGAQFFRGEVWSADRVVFSAEEKRRLRDSTGAAVVEMESCAVAEKARQWGVPFRCVRVVSDEAGGDLPLDFNLYRDGDGRFQLVRIALAALRRPLTVLPELIRLDRDCRTAAERLGEFLADCEY